MSETQFAKLRSVAIVGMQAHLVWVEVQMDTHLPVVEILGLPSAGVREARQRVRAAVINSGEEWPSKRITFNLAPGDLRKEGALLDLPMAMCVLAGARRVDPAVLERFLFVGELALDGGVRPVRGAVAAALAARTEGIRTLVVPAENANEAALVPGVQVAGVRTLSEAVRVASGRLEAHVPPLPIEEMLARAAGSGPDMAEIRGQALARRAVEIAAAGGHNLLLVGPPGSGKTMLARRMPGILPPLDVDEALETTQLWSVVGLLTPEAPMVTARPFRAPHHHASANAIVGGGSPVPRPGEISLACHGVLFLDELPFFSLSTLDGLRQPLEDRRVTIARMGATYTFPAETALVAAANPCLCSHQSGAPGSCRCPPGRLDAYRSRLSGPLLDRMDLQVEVAALTNEELLDLGPSEPSALVRSRVVQARKAQLHGPRP